MSKSPTTEFHKIWIERCAAAERIRRRFGLQTALDYLLAEKLVALAESLDRHPEAAVDLPWVIAQIRRVFTDSEIREYLDHPERSEYLTPRRRFATMRQVFQWQRHRRRKPREAPEGSVKRLRPVSHT